MIKTIFMLVRMHVRSQMEYRAAFVMDRVAQILSYGAAFSAIWAPLNPFSTLGAWRWSHMALLLSFQLLAYSLGASLSFVQFRDLEEQVRLGTFDALLVRPINPWLYLTFSGLNIGYLGHVILAVRFDDLGARRRRCRLDGVARSVFCGSAGERLAGGCRGDDNDRRFRVGARAVELPIFDLFRLLGTHALSNQHLPRSPAMGFGDSGTTRLHELCAGGRVHRQGCCAAGRVGHGAVAARRTHCCGRCGAALALVSRSISRRRRLATEWKKGKHELERHHDRPCLRDPHA